MKQIILGLAGTFCSGKDLTARYLQEKYGLLHISTSDMVRDIAMAKYGSIERPILYRAANEVRKERGHGALSELAMERFEEQKVDYPAGLVVSGFRAIAEAEVIHKYGGKVIFIDAPFELRFSRMQARARDKETTLTREEFEERERNENGGVDSAFNISAIKDIADYCIQNNEDQKKFLSQIDELVSSIAK